MHWDEWQALPAVRSLLAVDSMAGFATWLAAQPPDTQLSAHHRIGRDVDGQGTEYWIVTGPISVPRGAALLYAASPVSLRAAIHLAIARVAGVHDGPEPEED